MHDVGSLGELPF